MEKFRIRENYSNIEEVEETFRIFVTSLIYQSIEGEAQNDDIKLFVENYCKNNARKMIAATNTNVREYINSINQRYKVTSFELDCKQREIVETKKTFSTNNYAVVIKKAAEFFRNGRNPIVLVYDNEEEKLVTRFTV